MPFARGTKKWKLKESIKTCWRPFLKFPSRAIQANRIELANALAGFHLLVLRISFQFLRSLSHVPNLIYWGFEGKGSCGGAATNAITINNEAAAAAPSRFAFVSSDVLLPSLVEKSQALFFASVAALSLWDFCTINVNCFLGKLCVPRTQKL